MEFRRIKYAHKQEMKNKLTPYRYKFVTRCTQTVHVLFGTVLLLLDRVVYHPFHITLYITSEIFQLPTVDVFFWSTDPLRTADVSLYMRVIDAFITCQRLMCVHAKHPRSR